jgi:excinuclease ABC subunit A
VRADGKIHSTGERLRLDRFREHNVEIVVGVLEAKRTAAVPSRSGSARPRDTSKSRRASNTASAAGRETRAPQQLIDETLKLGQGTLFALDNHSQLTVHSTERACPQCGRSFEPLDPKNFSYNSPQGWCPKCRGFGELFYLPEDVDRGARADAIEESWYGWQEGERELCPECNGARLNPVARAVRLPLFPLALGARVAVKTEHRRFHDCVPQLFPLPEAEGQGEGKQRARIARKLLLEVGPTIEDFSRIPVASAFEFFRRFKFTGAHAVIARDILPEIRERLRFLHQVGLGYLQLGRGMPTLSSGEGQRIRLAAQLGSNLSGVLYVLDEPTIGLHARDNQMLLSTLAILRSRGNSLVVVEHDEETMRRSDYIIDLGPGAGIHGGQVIAAGTLNELLRHEDSLTGQCLRAQAAKKYPARGRRRPVTHSGARAPGSRQAGKAASGKDERSDSPTSPPTQLPAHWLTLEKARVNNLKDITVQFPLNRLVFVTGVSGSGKSTLIRDCLLPALEAALKSKSRHHAARSTHRASRLLGFDSIRAVYEVDQSPIGRTPRSTPATYVGFFGEIRNLFAQLPEARLRGYTASRFSFNSAQGRCPECEGAGTIKLEMNFLPPAYVRCETCNGLRFNRETLDIEFHGRNISQVLELSVAEAIEFFAAFPRIRRPLEALRDTGLDYLHLGQTSPTLSGGEAQRVKLVTHLLSGLKEQLTLFDPREKRNLFLLEEPTIGLHMADVRRLVEVLQRLVDAGHTVIVIEHNLDLIAEADWIIDLGPEGGDAGGRIVAEGTPEEVAAVKHSHTGRFLRRLGIPALNSLPGARRRPKML